MLQLSIIVLQNVISNLFPSDVNYMLYEFDK